MHLFIDTNTLVGFYEMSSVSLVELEKVISVIKKKEATLWLPDQVKREFWKNREGSVVRVLNEFDKAGVLPAAPVLVREEKRFLDLQKQSKEVERLKAEIVEAIRTQIAEETTRADTAVRALFEVATDIDTSAHFNAAHERSLRRLLPGKDEAIGDRLNWISLLAAVPEGSELHIISDDGDFESEGTKGKIKTYLAKEWASKKNGAVHLWKRISQYLAAHFPDAESAMDLERAIAVKKLAESSSFSSTHMAVAELSSLSGFSPVQVQDIANAVLSNSQINFIATDSDVAKFLDEFLNAHSGHLEPETIAAIRKHMEK
jgi:hypothetical protein